ncbi:hypothetical protein [Infirmifilum sp. NZ]|uniref:hypothetical protein n=1 Tax=Infirmifilum sp. NZ TaxID=2926850 RepID=UPI0027A7D2CC|nr:hypothetical protein [Infirmifilum sp. NZ]UNQ73791.1 hypothetical protein MOV14_01960 [Infirmifilum sp. NZ]
MDMERRARMRGGEAGRAGGGGAGGGAPARVFVDASLVVYLSVSMLVEEARLAARFWRRPLGRKKF